MLYLNLKPPTPADITPNLTLTSVVFEYNQNDDVRYLFINLTLTSVVFELSILKNTLKINSNLTLTSVVFECVPKIWLNAIV